MSFLWGSPKAAPKPDFVETPPSQAREFAENTNQKDLELQAILEGTSITAPPITEVPAVPKARESNIPAAAGSSSKGARSSAKGKKDLAEKATDAKLVPDAHLCFGVPRKYIVVGIVTLFFLLLLFRLMGNIWQDSDLNTKVIDGVTGEEKPATSAKTATAHSHY